MFLKRPAKTAYALPIKEAHTSFAGLRLLRGVGGGAGWSAAVMAQSAGVDVVIATSRSMFRCDFNGPDDQTGARSFTEEKTHSLVWTLLLRLRIRFQMVLEDYYRSRYATYLIMPSKPIDPPPQRPKKVQKAIRDEAPVDDYKESAQSREQEEENYVPRRLRTPPPFAAGGRTGSHNPKSSRGPASGPKYRHEYSQ
ncbi:hypothetical protein VTN00DRAFT_4687 [Thermoascus crustaceus]|uniref:uncharacterized protein n=1 Tax=Thermoascus crustaceus TaxID=5088 RepID=UPI0037432118